MAGRRFFRANWYQHNAARDWWANLKRRTPKNLPFHFFSELRKISPLSEKEVSISGVPICPLNVRYHTVSTKCCLSPLDLPSLSCQRHQKSFSVCHRQCFHKKTNLERRVSRKRTNKAVSRSKQTTPTIFYTPCLDPEQTAKETITPPLVAPTPILEVLIIVSRKWDTFTLLPQDAACTNLVSIRKSDTFFLSFFLSFFLVTLRYVSLLFLLIYTQDSNSDGSYYYANDNGSTYYNSGNGSSTYTSPGGHTTSK